MEVSGSNEVRHLKIAWTKCFKVHCGEQWGGGGKAKQTNIALPYSCSGTYEAGLLVCL